jgi:hypothetical protein
MLAIEFQSLLFLLFIAVALLFQLLTRMAKPTSEDSDELDAELPPPPRIPPPIRRPKPRSDEERIREFLEALGQPTTAKPPPRVQPRPTYKKPVVLPRVPPFGSPLPPLTTRPPESGPDWPLPREIRLPGQIPPTRTTKIFTPKVAEPAPAFEVHDTPAPPPAVATTPAEAYAIATERPAKRRQTEIDLATLLRSTSGLRQAVIMREVFGPPRSLQPLELIVP